MDEEDGYVIILIVCIAGLVVVTGITCYKLGEEAGYNSAQIISNSAGMTESLIQNTEGNSTENNTTTPPGHILEWLQIDPDEYEKWKDTDPAQYHDINNVINDTIDEWNHTHFMYRTYENGSGYCIGA